MQNEYMLEYNNLVVSHPVIQSVGSQPLAPVHNRDQTNGQNLKFSLDIHCPQRMNSNDYGDSLTFQIAPFHHQVRSCPWATLRWHVRYIQNELPDCREICCRYWWSSDEEACFFVGFFFVFLVTPLTFHPEPPAVNNFLFVCKGYYNLMCRFLCS